MTQFWEDDCPLLQEIIWGEWPFYRDKVMEEGTIVNHYDFLSGFVVQELLKQKRSMRERVIATYSDVLGIGKSSNVLSRDDFYFRGKLGERMDILLNLPIIGEQQEACFLIFSASISDKEPEELIRTSVDLMEARNFLASRGYKPGFSYDSTGNIDYSAGLGIKSLEELKEFSSELEKMYKLFEREK
jgi:hypothetical protein